MKLSRLLLPVLLLVLLLAAAGAWGATGDIDSVVINPDGWSAAMTIEGLDSSGVWSWGIGAKNNPTTAKVVLTVQRMGFSDAGVDTTLLDTVYGTRQLRMRYGHETQDSCINVGSDVKFTFALSSYIFDKDSVLSCSVTKGLYITTDTSLMASIVPTNTSTLNYPRVIANWSRVPFRLIATDTMFLGAVAYHQSGRNGRPVRCVKFTASDKHSHTVSIVSTNMEIDLTQRDTVPVQEFIGRILMSTFTNGDTITCNFQAFPWYGDSACATNTADGVNTQGPLYSPVYNIKNSPDVYGVTVAAVDSATGNDATGAVTTAALFDPASPPALYKTFDEALKDIAAYNNTNYSRNSCGGGIVYAKKGTYAFTGGGSSYGAVLANTWAKITAFPGVSRDSVVIGSQSGNYDICGMPKISGITVSGSMSFLVRQSRFGWMDSCVINVDGTASPWYLDTLIYITRNRIIKQDMGIGPYSAYNSSVVLFRGNYFPGPYNGSVYSYTGLGNKFNYHANNNIHVISNVYGQQAPVAHGNIWAHNIIYSTGTSGELVFDWWNTDTTSFGFAVVNNLIASAVPGGGYETWRIGATGTSTNTPVNNGIVWNNTSVGHQFSMAYNNAGTASVHRIGWSEVNNLVDNHDIKSDLFGTQNAARIGNWSSLYGAAYKGNLFAEVPIASPTAFNSEFPGLYSLQNSAVQDSGYIQYVDNNSSSGHNTGGGNYVPKITSPALTLGSTAWVLPYDITGKARSQTINYAGAYNGAIYLDSIRPVSGYGATSITVYGRNFGATQGSSTLAFGDSVPTPSAWSDTAISFPCPLFPVADTGLYSFVVDDGTVADTLADAFLYKFPIITSLLHPMGRKNYADTTLGKWFGTGTATFKGPVTITRQTSDSIFWTVPDVARGTDWWKYCIGNACDSIAFRKLTPTITIINP